MEITFLKMDCLYQSVYLEVLYFRAQALVPDQIWSLASNPGCALTGSVTWGM